MSPSGQAELGYRDLLATLRRWRWQILLFIAISTSATCAASLILPKQYEAIVVLSPVTNSSTNGLLSSLNSVASQFSGLAALAGLSQNADSTKSESLAVLESEVLTEEYIQKNGILPILYADKWDVKRNAWKDMDNKQIPTLWTANQLFKKKIRKITAEGKTGLITLTITWKDPKVAAKWANDLVQMTNDYRREKAISEAARNIDYLNTEVAKTDVVGVRQAIFSILQAEISKMMLAKGNDEFALKVVDPAVPPEKPSWPQPIVWTLIAFFASFTICMGFAFVQSSLEDKSGQPGSTDYVPGTHG